MDLRITVNYMATDGRLPESVEVECTSVDEHAPGVAMVVLDRLLAAPGKAAADVVMTFADDEKVPA